MSPAASLARPLGAFEWAMWLSAQGITANCLAVGEVVGVLDEHVLREALEWTQRKHPLLRVRIALTRGRPHFEPTLASIPLRVTAGEWRPIAEYELSTPLDTLRGPLARCTLVLRENEPATLMLSFSHVVVDGYSVLAIFDDVLRAADGILSGRPLSPEEVQPRSAIEDHLPERFAGLKVLPDLLRFVAREQLGMVRGGTPRSLVPEGTRVSERRLQLITHEFDPALTERLVSASKLRAVPFQATLAAAQLLGIADEIGSDVVPSWLGSSVNLRSKLEPPVTRPDETGLFVSLVGSSMKVDRRLSLWSVAAALHRDNAARLARGEAFLTFPLGSKTFSLVRRVLSPDAVGGLRFIALMKKMFPAGTATSNMGKVSIGLPEGAALRLERLHFAATESVMQLTSVSLTFRGRLHWNFMNYVGETGERAVSGIIRRLRTAVDTHQGS